MVVHVEPPSIEIAAPPALVREVALDFPSYPTWHKGHFNSITVPSKKAGKDIVPGDKLAVALASGMNFSPAILENTPERLKWRGSLPLIFTGDHVFEFQPSKKTPGATTLVQYEDFSGLLSFTMKTEKRSGADNHKGFVAFNEDVKKEAERRQAAATAA